MRSWENLRTDSGRIENRQVGKSGEVGDIEREQMRDVVGSHRGDEPGIVGDLAFAVVGLKPWRIPMFSFLGTCDIFVQGFLPFVVGQIDRFCRSWSRRERHRFALRFFQRRHRQFLYGCA